MTGKNVRDEQGSYYFGQEWYGVFLGFPSFLAFLFKKKEKQERNPASDFAASPGSEPVHCWLQKEPKGPGQRGSAVGPAPAPGRTPPAMPLCASVCPFADWRQFWCLLQRYVIEKIK